MEFPGCTAVKLTAKSGHPYWFRTCDIGGDIWANGAHAVSFPVGAKVSMDGREEPLTVAHAFLGLSYNALDTWLLDGVNDAGLVGGLLALYEATSVQEADEGEDGVVGMELITRLLATCATVEEVICASRRIRLLDTRQNEEQTAATMHFMFLEPSGRCVILEAADCGAPGCIEVYEDNLGLMTNSPPYPQQLQNLSWYLANSPEWNWGKETTPCLILNGMTVKGDCAAPHFCMSGTFPASYASCDRFVRMAMLSYLNQEGKYFSDQEMLALGSDLMCSVIEPHNQGIYHYTRFDEKEGPQGGHASYTQYLVMYSPRERELYLKPYGTTAWTRLRLGDCSLDKMEHHKICRYPLAGVVEEKDL